MKKVNNIFSILILCVLFLSACQDDDNELGVMLDKSQVKFEVEQIYSIDEGGNTVVLRNLTPETVAMWDYGTGRSTRTTDTVRFPFQGEYVIKFSAMTAGGVVAMDPITIEVTEDNLMYVSDPLWIALTGGVGESKTWIPDNGKYGLAPGPLSYADPGGNPTWGDFSPNWEPSAGDIGATADDMAAEMTFSLEGGAFLTTVKPNEGVNESGTFYLNTDAHTLSTTNATIIRPASFIPNAANWTNSISILELNENQLRVAIMRTNEEGPWVYILNYVSKEYAEKYVPGYSPDPNFDHGNQMEILAGSSSTTWKMSTESPFNWAKLDGSLMNPWYNSSDYPDWTGYSESAIPNIENVRLTFTKTGDVVLRQNDGTVEQGVFSINENKNLVTFEGIKPSILISGGWVTATTTDYFEDEAGNRITGDNQWKIVKTYGVAGVTTDIWFGKRDPFKAEYMVYHFVLESELPDLSKVITRALAGGVVGETSRTFKIDLHWPVDWVNPLGEGWTVAGTQDGWYWSEDIAASVENQSVTFTQINGEVTMSKIDEAGNTSTSPVEINSDGIVTIPDANIIQFGAGSWLPTAGPEYKWVKQDVDEDGEVTGFWIGKINNPSETIVYHYILED